MSKRVGSLLYLVLLVLLSTCDRGLAKDAAPRSQNMLCTPGVLQPGDELEIQLPQNHGSDMAFVDPKGDYYFLAFEQPDPRLPLRPPLRPEEFRTMTRMRLKVSEIKGIPWSSSSTAPEAVFRAAGEYKILISHALETEDPVLDGWCRVSFRTAGPPRPR